MAGKNVTFSSSPRCCSMPAHLPARVVKNILPRNIKHLCFPTCYPLNRIKHLPKLWTVRSGSDSGPFGAAMEILLVGTKSEYADPA